MPQEMYNKTTTDLVRQQRYVDAFKTSNLTQTEFCRQHKLPDSTFFNWKKKFAPSLVITKSAKIKNHKILQTNFLEIPNYVNNTPHTTICTIKRLDGTQLIIAAEKQQLVSLMEAFLCCK